jgi:hypothetical protein
MFLLILIYDEEVLDYRLLIMLISLSYFFTGDIEPPPPQKKKGFFKSFWKKSRHYSLEQN